MAQKRKPKTRTVWVRCMVVSSDGCPVDEHGNEFGKGAPVFELVKRRRKISWLNNPKNRGEWYPLRGQTAPIK